MVIEPGNGGFNASNTQTGRARQQEALGKGENAAPAKTPSPAPPVGDNVSLSTAGRSIPLIEAKINDAPDYNADKVSQIKAAIADGSYKIDSSAIATKLRIEESQLG